MSAEHFLNLMRLQASMVNNANAQTALGTIIAYDPVNYFVNVELYPANPTSSNPQPLTTNWIPLFSPWVGNQFGIFFAPNIGDVVEVHFQEGSFQNAYAGMRCFQIGQNLQVPTTECWIVHQTGSYIKLLTDGTIEVFASGTAPITVTSAGVVNVTASAVNISGEVSLGNLSSTLTGLLTGSAMSIYNEHTHDIVGGGVTNIPNELMSSSDVTSNVLGN